MTVQEADVTHRQVKSSMRPEVQLTDCKVPGGVKTSRGRGDIEEGGQEAKEGEV